MKQEGDISLVADSGVKYLKGKMINRLFRFLKRVFCFYLEGFRDMSSWGRKLWIIIIIKLFIIFAILKVFFFPDLLKRNFEDDQQRGEYVMDQLISND